ncbi:hypothetical protein Tco_1401529 [Tanacetum coccineum]
MNYSNLQQYNLPAPEVIALIPEVVAQNPAASTGSPSSTTADQDAPSTSDTQTTSKTQSSVISNDVEEDWKRIFDKRTKNKTKKQQNRALNGRA